jgi:hypothetical protein
MTKPSAGAGGEIRSMTDGIAKTNGNLSKSKLPLVLRQNPLWVITSYFCYDDPPHEKRRLHAYRSFRRHLQLPLVTVEHSPVGAFDLGPGDAEVLIQLQEGDLLWQKERLLNIALEALPPHCDTVAWMDCDIIPLRPDWAEATRRELNGCRLVQPFTKLHFLPRGAALDTWPEIVPYKTYESVVSYLARFPSQAKHLGVRGSSQQIGYAPGGVWAARKDTIRRHGFYDAGILGSGDKMLVSAAFGHHAGAIAAYEMAPVQAEHYAGWARAFHETVKGGIGCIEGEMLHVWHGAIEHRYYRERYDDFRRFAFDPSVDVARTATGAWRWNSDKPQLHAFVRRYFGRRQGQS